jgi:dephospho-CoA kinase
MTEIGIALTGKMRSGKDTIGKYLVDYYDFKRFAFGDELKRLAHDLFGDPVPGTKPRELYQLFGQAMRTFDNDVWVRKMFDQITFWQLAQEYAYRRIVVCDLRQPNEYKRCKAQGYVIIRVNCDDMLRRQRIISAGDVFNDEDFRHETESYIDSFDVDYEIFNDGHQIDLYEQVDSILRDIERRRTAGITT